MTQPYPQFVASRLKLGAEINDSMTPERANLSHIALGIAGEAGEIVDAIKKHVIYNKPLDVQNLREEIGDVLFFLQALCNVIGYSIPDATIDNQEKLTKRYATGYSDKAAQERADKS